MYNIFPSLHHITPEDILGLCREGNKRKKVDPQEVCYIICLFGFGRGGVNSEKINKDYGLIDNTYRSISV